MQPKNIYRIVLTGGPCGGKSSALSFLKEKVEEIENHMVFVIPEMATLCINAGVMPGKNSISGNMLQNAILNISLSIENNILEVAKNLPTDQKIVVIYDRGIPDGSAYMEKEDYLSLLQTRELNPVSASHARYDAVIHMVTAAEGAEDFYTLANNSARHETPQQARDLDKRTQQVWVGHPHLRVVDNSTDFQEKLHRVYQEVCVVIGVPVPVERERKFLVKFNPMNIPQEAVSIDIEQIYLTTGSDQAEIRIRKRGHDGFYTYFMTEKRDHGPGQRLEVERIIGENEFELMSSMIKPDTCPVNKTRHCIIWTNLYLELDVFKNSNTSTDPSSEIGMLEIELTNLEHELQIPEWIEIIQEVTEDKEYTNAVIAERIFHGKPALKLVD